MSTVPAALYAKHVPLWSKEEKRAHLDEYIRQLVEARDTIKQLLGSPEFHTPEVQAQINALADKFHMTEEAQPAVPQSQPAASAAASQPEGEGEGGFLRWLSGLWRGWTGDDPAAAAKQQDEPQRAVEEKQAYGEDYAREIIEARATLLQLLDSPDFYTPEVQQQMQAIMAKFSMQKGQAQPSVPLQSQQAASAATSVPQPSSNPAASSDGFFDWLSGLFRRPRDDGTAAEQQVEPQCAEERAPLLRSSSPSAAVAAPPASGAQEDPHTGANELRQRHAQQAGEA